MRAVQAGPDDPSSNPYPQAVSVEMFTLDNYMFVNADTLASLQIIHSEMHPNNQIWGPDKSSHASKESLSVYGLFHLLAATPQGRVKLRQMFIRPSVDVELIQRRQRTISGLLRPENTEVLKSINHTLKNIRNIRSTLAQLRKGVEFSTGRPSIDRGVWRILWAFALHSLKLREIVLKLSGTDSITILDKVRF
jgi:DNA mismatch repair protein MSH5